MAATEGLCYWAAVRVQLRSISVPSTPLTVEFQALPKALLTAEAVESVDLDISPQKPKKGRRCEW